jgi:hypothetical protein
VALITAFGGAALADVGRPNREAGPTRVDAGVVFLDVNSVSGAKQSFDANIIFVLTWMDPRLAHDLEGKSMPLNAVWHPNLRLVNRLDAKNTFPEVVSITPDGRVTYRQRMLGSFSQLMDLRDFPFDSQSFTIRAFTAGYSPDDVEIVIDPRSQMLETMSVPDWDIQSWNVEATAYKPLPTDPLELASIVFSFEGERRKAYFIYKVILPLILIVSMSWIVFWIDPKDFGPQISVAVTTMLTLIAYRFAMGGSLPKVDYMTRLDFFILGATVLVYVTLLQAVTTSGMTKAGKGDNALAVDRWCRVIFPALFVVLGIAAFA